MRCASVFAASGAVVLLMLGLATLLTGLRVKKETIGEIAAAAQVMRELATPVDVVEILSTAQQGPRPRMPRIEVDCFATVRDGGRVHRMRVHDVSQGGVKLESAVLLDAGADLVVSLPGLDPQSAAVRWSEDGYLGVTFNRLLPLTELVDWLRATREQLRTA